jgi:hypothetical protein
MEDLSWEAVNEHVQTSSTYLTEATNLLNLAYLIIKLLLLNRLHYGGEVFF